MGRYVGSVTSVPNGYAFISRASLRRRDGAELDVETVDDIFVHNDDCACDLVVGLVLTFDLIADEHRTGERGRPCFRAQTATEYLELVPANGPVMPGFTVVRAALGGVSFELSGAAERFVRRLKADDVEAAQANRPLDGLPADGDAIRIGGTMDDVRAFLEAYLRSLFENLGAIEGFDSPKIAPRLAAWTMQGKFENRRFSMLE